MSQLLVAAVSDPFRVGPVEFGQCHAFNVAVVVPVEVRVEACVVVHVVVAEFLQLANDVRVCQPVDEFCRADRVVDGALFRMDIG